MTGKTPSNLRQPTDNTIIEKNVAVYLKEQGVEEYLQAFPFGSNEAPIGFILDFDIPSLKYDGENASALPAHFPSALRLIGFHEQNCLTWPFNFQAPFVPRKLKLAGSRDGDTYLREINRQIIDNSNLQVIILCGINAERMAILSSPSFKKITFTIEKNVVGGLLTDRAICGPTGVFEIFSTFIGTLFKRLEGWYDGFPYNQSCGLPYAN